MPTNNISDTTYDEVETTGGLVVEQLNLFNKFLHPWMSIFRTAGYKMTDIIPSTVSETVSEVYAYSFMYSLIGLWVIFSTTIMRLGATIRIKNEATNKMAT